ncbi:hypothetical protein SPWS13_0888 [Shewanella putrefaciens]|nr:hypothetical protein SPWS13_0888 [Shewanella putrefaciens]
MYILHFGLSFFVPQSTQLNIESQSVPMVLIFLVSLLKNIEQH